NPHLWLSRGQHDGRASREPDSATLGQGGSPPVTTFIVKPEGEAELRSKIVAIDSLLDEAKAIMCRLALALKAEEEADDACLLCGAPLGTHEQPEAFCDRCLRLHLWAAA